MTYGGHYTGMHEIGSREMTPAYNPVDGILDDPKSLEPKTDRITRTSRDEAWYGITEFRGGGTDHLDVDTSVHVRKKA